MSNIMFLMPGQFWPVMAPCGWNIPPDYDSLLAKVVVIAPSRRDAILKMRTALEMTTIVGIKTNIPLHLGLLSNSNFLKGDYDIQFMESYILKGGRPNSKK